MEAETNETPPAASIPEPNIPERRSAVDNEARANAMAALAGIPVGGDDSASETTEEPKANGTPINETSQEANTAPETKAEPAEKPAEKPADAAPPEPDPEAVRARELAEKDTKDRLHQLERAKFKKEREAFEAQRKAMSADDEKRLRAAELIASNDKAKMVEGFKLLDANYDNLTAGFLSGGLQQAADIPEAVNQRLAEIEAANEKLVTEAASAKQAAADADAVGRLVGDLAKPENQALYPMLSTDPSAASRIWSTYKAEWEAAGKHLDEQGNALAPRTPDQIAADLEGQLWETVKPLLDNPKVREHLNLQPPKQDNGASASQSARQDDARADGANAGSVTLTNELAASATREPVNNADPDECKRRAMALIPSRKS